MGVVQETQVQLGQWTGKEFIEVISLDNYEFVVGLDFLKRINALLLPFANCLCILNPRYLYMVPVRRETGQAKVQSAIQLAKNMRKNEDTFLVALKLDKAPKTIDETPLEVLESFRDVMPLEFPKQLPPKWEVDHKIEQVPNVQPPSRAPYRMSPIKLEELRK